MTKELSQNSSENLLFRRYFECVFFFRIFFKSINIPLIYMADEELNKYGLPGLVVNKLKEQKITKLNPVQKKALKKGVLKGKNLLVCSPTSSGKTLIATFAIANMLDKGTGKAVYIVPLRALASEKYKEYKKFFEKTDYEVALSTGDIDSSSEYLAKYDLIILTVEKLDSLIRHHSSWIKDINLTIIDEIHLMNDVSRGPTLEVLITLLKQLLKNMQLIALSATIGNPDELAEWIGAEVVYDKWRPVKLHKGIYFNGAVEFK